MPEDLPVKLDPKGGGGTDFRPVFNEVEDRGIDPACVVYLTDGWGVYPEEEPPYPVLWVLTQEPSNPNYHPPFGEVVTL